MHSSIHISLINENWDKLNHQFPGWTFFDSARWLYAFRRKCGEVRCYGFFQRERCIASISLGVTLNDVGVLISSPFTAPFGGMLFGTNMQLACLDECLRILLDTLAAEFSGRPLRFTYVQRPKHVSMHPLYDMEEFVLALRGFRVSDIQFEYYLDLSNRHYSQTLRNELSKKSQLIQFEITCMDEFLAFRNKILPQQRKSKTVPDDEMIQIGTEFADNVRVYKATVRGETASMLVSDEVSPECAIGRNWFQDDSFSAIGTTAFLVGQWIEEIHAHKFLRAGFGGTATLAGGFKPGMAYFKERFHPQASLRKYYVFEKP